MSAQGLNDIIAQRLAPEALQDGPVAATFGHYCRSSGFAGHGHEEWVEAIQYKPGHWKLFKVSVQDEDEGAQGRVAQRIEIHGRFGFYTILQRLAEYEFSYGDKESAYIRVDGPDKLGTDHYIAFGKREGIAFDTHTGKPLMTVRGHIVKSGSIDLQTMQDLRRAWDAKEMAFLPSTQGMCPNFGPEVNPKALDALCTTIEDCDKVSDIQKKFETLIGAFVDMAKGAKTKSAPVHTQAEFRQKPHRQKF